MSDKLHPKLFPMLNALRKMKVTCRAYTRRSKATQCGYKLYFELESQGIYGVGAAHADFYRRVQPAVREYFPRAVVTSGSWSLGGFHVTMTEFPSWEGENPGEPKRKKKPEAEPEPTPDDPDIDQLTSERRLARRSR